MSTEKSWAQEKYEKYGLDYFNWAKKYRNYLFKVALVTYNWMTFSILGLLLLLIIKYQNHSLTNSLVYLYFGLMIGGLGVVGFFMYRMVQVNQKFKAFRNVRDSNIIK